MIDYLAISKILASLAATLGLLSQQLAAPIPQKLGGVKLRGIDTVVYCLPGNKTPIAPPTPSALTASQHNATSTWILLESSGNKRNDYTPLSTTTPRMVPIYDYMFETYPNVKAYLNKCP